jgi:hypothetical protein
MCCLSCARIDGSGVAIVMGWNERRARFERQRRDVPFATEFATRIREAFPAMPEGVETAIADHACAKRGRIGRTRLAKSFDARAIVLAVRAHIRHRETGYDAMLASGAEVWEARRAVEPVIAAVLARWRGRSCVAHSPYANPGPSDPGTIGRSLPCAARSRREPTR